MRRASPRSWVSSTNYTQAVDEDTCSCETRVCLVGLRGKTFLVSIPTQQVIVKIAIGWIRSHRTRYSLFGKLLHADVFETLPSQRLHRPSISTFTTLLPLIHQASIISKSLSDRGVDCHYRYFDVQPLISQLSFPVMQPRLTAHPHPFPLQRASTSPK
jgi:hypothetical protein